MLIIDFAEALHNERAILISELADTVEYIALQTPRDVIIYKVKKIVFYEEYMYLISRGTCYLFSKDGWFIQAIGGKGGGPGEYTLAFDFEIDKKRREVVISGIPHVLLHYSLDGKYLDTSARDVRAQWLAFSDTALWCTVLSTPP
jgi:hypothetical protein